MPFGRPAKPNNRSQHNLAVESAGSSSSTGAPSVSVNVSSTASGTGTGPGPVSGIQGIQGIGVSASGAQARQVNHQPPPGPGPGPGPGLTQLQVQGPSSSASALGQGPTNLPLTTNDSFVQDLRAVSQNQQPPPPHLYGPLSGQDLSAAQQGLKDHSQAQAQLHQLHPLNTGTAVSDAEARKAASKFVDAVTRSQSQRYNTVATPIQSNPSFGASYEDLSRPIQATPQDQQSIAYHQHQQQQQQQQQHRHHGPPPQPPPPPTQSAPVEPRRSTRRLIKNILGGTPRNDTSRSGHSHHPSESQLQLQAQSHSFYDNTGGLARRPSKRISNPNPPALRTGPSQVSLDQQSLDWQSQGAQSQSQPSPLQTNPHEFQQSTLRRVPTNQDQSPYSDIDESSFRHQVHAPTQLNPDYEHQGQIAFDQATRQYQYIPNSAHSSPQGPLQPDSSPLAYQGHLGIVEQLRNPETVSQVSHESPVGEGDLQNSSAVPSTTVSPARYSTQAQDFPSRSSSLHPQQQQGQQQLSPEDSEQQRDMAPPSGAPPQARGDMQQGAPPGYRHSAQPSKSINPSPAGTQAGAGPNNFRQSTIQERPLQQFDGSAEQGRNSPQPSEDPEKAFKDLLQKYKNVKRLYFDGKTQIEQLNGQVEQLQNAVANQRISQSRTALDDSEYTTRFNRLNGAINNLSFNIRKDWTSLPPWLDKYVSADALKTGKQEMTAVGRAVITRWIVEEIFYSCFHPGLDPELSRQLKSVEQNIRRFSYTLTSQEEFDALTSKVVSWRMTTLEGLQDVLNSPESANYRQEFTRNATANLTACLFQHLSDPPPAGVDGSASMIVELAVGIAANLPLESRDVAILLPLPQDGVQPEIMDVEKTPLPVIETRPPDSEGEGGEDTGKESGGEKSHSKERNKSRAALPPKDGNKVRFAGFLAVEVRGRQVLVKAPVWTLG
ncbi:hypothetical protein N0V93_005520 [Gnomoniopsis smithogilvyi]|uniref:S-adenosylmethionine-dependent methyltransferase-like protein n=1 Tax=Gnomoniopsis smithogilvyi TaxID=1191159 RepID=A0A9W8YVR0_9PEZI|nr:hypothetical protein N0V93_005520 [Gnomoniopsis smithogilvyi]